MGINISGFKKKCGTKVKNVPVDGGSSVCMDDRRLTRTASANASSSNSNTNNRHRSKAKQPTGYKIELVSELIARRKLAPFYEGIEEQQGKESGVMNIETEQNIDANDGRNVPNAATPAVTVSTRKISRGCFAIRLFKKKRQQRESSNAPTDSLPNETQKGIVNPKWLSTNLVDCPICCLSYPLNTNWTACCSQPLCTFCFLHLRFPPSGREISCPFCNGTGFGVKYYDPEVLTENGLTEKILRGEAGENDALSENGNLVKSEMVRIKPSIAIAPRPRHHSRQYSYNRPGTFSASSGDYYHRRQSSYINAHHEPWYFTPANIAGDGGYMNTGRYGASPWFAFP